MDNYKQIYIQKLATSTIKERYLLIYNGQYYEASAPVAELLSFLQEGDTPEKAIKNYITEKNYIFSYGEVEELITRYINPILTPKDKSIKKTFLYERELFPSTAIDRFSDRFRFLFNLKWIYLFMGIVLALNTYFFYSAGNLLNFNSTVNAYIVIGLLIFMLFSSVIHEIGHASACKFFNIHHGGIGFGLYLNFPVLYTDVTEVWRLKRRQRCIVNMAGVYFQSYLLLITLLIYFMTGHDMPRYMILVINLGFIMTLNPFFKFDGYWMISDILGIPNLRERSKELLNYWFKRMRKKEIKEIPYLLTVNRLGRYGLLIYSIVVNIFMGYYFFYILPKFILGFTKSFPDEVHQLILFISNDITPSFALIRNIVMQLLLLILITIFAFNLIKKLLVYTQTRHQ